MTMTEGKGLGGNLVPLPKCWHKNSDWLLWIEPGPPWRLCYIACARS